MALPLLVIVHMECIFPSFHCLPVYPYTESMLQTAYSWILFMHSARQCLVMGMLSSIMVEVAANMEGFVVFVMFILQLFLFNFFLFYPFSVFCAWLTLWIGMCKCILILFCVCSMENFFMVTMELTQNSYSYSSLSKTGNNLNCIQNPFRAVFLLCYCCHKLCLYKLCID